MLKKGPLKFNKQGSNQDDSKDDEQNLFHNKLYKMENSNAENSSNLLVTTNPTSVHINQTFKERDFYNSNLLNMNLSKNINNNKYVSPSSNYSKQINFMKSPHSPTKSIKLKINKNSAYAKYRRDLERNKQIIHKEVERSQAISYKHSEIYKKLKKEEELEKQRKEDERRRQYERQHEKQNENQMINTNQSNMFKTGISSNSVNSISKQIQNRSVSLLNVFSTEIQSLSNEPRKKTNSFNYNPISLKSKMSDKFLLKKIEEKIKKPNSTINFNFMNKSKTSNLNNNSFYKNDEIIEPSISSQNNELINENNQQLTTQTRPKKEIYSRKKTFTVKFIPGWFEKNGLPHQIFTHAMMNSVDDQSSVIVDQIKVLLDNCQFFKTKYLSSKDLILVFRSMDVTSAAKFNKVLEETCGLLLEIPSIILVDFAEYMDKFVTFKAPNPSRLKNRIVNDEEENFILNCKLLSECNLYMKSCFDVYNILIKQVDDMLVPIKTFQKLTQYLARTRYNISSLIMTCKNKLRDMNSDQKNLQKIQVKKIYADEDTNKGEDLNKKHGKRKPPLPKIKAKVKIQKSDMNDNFKKQLMFKINEENQRVIRLNGVLSNKNPFVHNENYVRDVNKKKIGHKSILNSNEMTKLLKYCKKNMKELILSERIIERYRQRNDNAILDSDD